MTEQKDERKKRILEFTSDFINDNGYSPSIREIGKGADISSTSLTDFYLNELEEDGLITTAKKKHISRSVRLTLAGYEFIGVDLLENPRRNRTEQVRRNYEREESYCSQAH